MKIAMVGSGYVGLVSGACFADFGHDVVCIDKDETKIAALHDNVMPIYEPGLDTLVAKNVEAGRLTFTTDLAEGIKDASAIFIAVGTPSRRGDGHADLSFVYAVAQEVGENLANDAVVVTKSTVPVGTGDEVERGKPAPDIFLEALRRSGVNTDASKCLVFEDAPSGVAAAVAAGMKVVAIPSVLYSGRLDTSNDEFKGADTVLSW